MALEDRLPTDQHASIEEVCKGFISYQVSLSDFEERMLTLRAVAWRCFSAVVA